MAGAVALSEWVKKTKEDRAKANRVAEAKASRTLLKEEAANRRDLQILELQDGVRGLKEDLSMLQKQQSSPSSGTATAIASAAALAVGAAGTAAWFLLLGPPSSRRSSP